MIIRSSPNGGNFFAAVKSFNANIAISCISCEKLECSNVQIERMLKCYKFVRSQSIGILRLLIILFNIYLEIFIYSNFKQK